MSVIYLNIATTIYDCAVIPSRDIFYATFLVEITQRLNFKNYPFSLMSVFYFYSKRVTIKFTRKNRIEEQ